MTLTAAISHMISHGWARFNADWLQLPPSQAQVSAPKVWTPPEAPTLTAEVLAERTKRLAEMKARWQAEKAA